MLVVVSGGKVIYQRSKYRLYPGEYCEKGGDESPPRTVSIGEHKILLLNCYEILFPSDYLVQNESNPNLVVQLVGVPMFDENQREGWVGLQQCLSLYYKCPVICCCGGRKGRMNISGVTMP